MSKKLLLFTLSCLLLLSASAFSAEITKGSTIAFNRSGDIWLMEADGSNQRPWVAGLTNVRGRMSWAPDNSKLVFARSGMVQTQFPDGGGHRHQTYDLFFAYPDSANNWWEGITETLGAFSPEFTANGSKIMFVHDLNGEYANAAFPKYRVALWDTKTFKIKDIPFEAESKLVATSPTISPDGKQVAFVVLQLEGQQFTPAGLTVVSVADFPIPDAELVARADKMPNATAPSWSPDGKWIAYISSDMSNPGLYLASADLSEQKLLYQPPAGLSLAASHPSWSPDGQMLLFSTINGSIYKIDLSGGEPQRLSGPGNDSAPAWCN